MTFLTGKVFIWEISHNFSLVPGFPRITQTHNYTVCISVFNIPDVYLFRGFGILCVQLHGLIASVSEWLHLLLQIKSLLLSATYKLYPVLSR